MHGLSVLCMPVLGCHHSCSAAFLLCIYQCVWLSLAACHPDGCMQLTSPLFIILQLCKVSTSALCKQSACKSSAPTREALIGGPNPSDTSTESQSRQASMEVTPNQGCRLREYARLHASNIHRQPSSLCSIKQCMQGAWPEQYAVCYRLLQHDDSLPNASPIVPGSSRAELGLCFRSSQRS